jgi:signal transduction histidine kinase
MLKILEWGIKKEDIDKLFRTFSRIKTQDITVERTGLGLYLTSKIVEILGLKLNVNSTFGKGSGFSIIIDKK